MNAPGPGHDRTDRPGEGRSPSGARRRARDEFLRGLRIKHPLVLIAAAALTVPCLLLINWLFAGGAYSGIPEERVLRRSGDDFMHIAWTVSRIRREASSEPLLCLFGGSSARESIVSGSSLAAEVATDGGIRLAGYDFGSSNQNFAATLAAIDNLPRNGGVMVIGLNAGRFAWSPAVNGLQSEGRKIPLASGALHTAIGDLDGPQRTWLGILPGVANYFASYLSEQRASLRRLQLPWTPYRLHRYTPAGRQSVARKEETVERWLDVRAPTFERYLDWNLDLLDETVALARERGFEVVLLELPWNEEIIGDRFEQAQEAYRAPCRQIAAERDATYLDLNPTLDLTSDDFYDLFHLVGDARARWQSALAEQLAAVVPADVASATTHEAPASTAPRAATDATLASPSQPGVPD